MGCTGLLLESQVSSESQGEFVTLMQKKKISQEPGDTHLHRGTGFCLVLPVVLGLSSGSLL